ncbi:MAG: hypothetical protein OHK006_20760 [Thermodesulfovibrionales bacterium]
MQLGARIESVVAIVIMTFGLNLFFGYFRGRSRKYSFKWFLYIHLPIPLIVIARIAANLDYRYIPLFLAAAVAGQMLGGRMEF